MLNFFNSQNINNVLIKFPEMVGPLTDAWFLLKRTFPNASFDLVSEPDSDVPGGSQLVLYVKTEIDPEEADARLEKITEHPDFSRINEVYGRLIILLV
jgi:hypothetical protein